MQKEISNHYFVFTKKEKRGTLVVLAVIFLIFISGKYVYPLLLRENISSANELKAAADSLQQMPRREYEHEEYAQKTGDQYSHTYERNESFHGELFYFDPNTLDAAGWKRLGVKERTAQSILKYISKGGKFRTADDINKIWGLHDDEKQRLIPYVRIAAQEKAQSNFTSYPTYEKKPYEKKVPEAVDINSGDSVSFVSLPGIGPGFSRRIINFRNKLGGFYKTEQVAETFGMPDSVYQKIKPFLKISSADLRKMNINTASNDELKAHPYIRWQLANLITEYRKQHGDFKSLADLKKIMMIDEETYQKIVPYLTL